jgi:Mrp family chromosome partitioning ATPase
MRDVVDYLKGQFDLLLFDAPPIIGVSDASVLVSKVDSVLMVIQHRSYPRAVSTRAKKMIEDVGGNILGAVLNSVNISRDYYYYHSYAGQYSYNESKSRLLVNAEQADEDAESRRRRGEKKGA